MPSGGGPGLQSRAGGNRIVPGGFDSYPFRQYRRYSYRFAQTSSVLPLRGDVVPITASRLKTIGFETADSISDRRLKPLCLFSVCTGLPI